MIADCVLAWRMYVIWGHARWAIALPMVAIILNGSKSSHTFSTFVALTIANTMKVLGVYGDCQHLIAYRSVELYVKRFEVIAFETNVAWGWTMLATHTAMTASIVGRLMYAMRSLHWHCAYYFTSSHVHKRTIRHCTVAQEHNDHSYGIVSAMIESAAVTWIGLLLYLIGSLAPDGHITVKLSLSLSM